MVDFRILVLDFPKGGEAKFGFHQVVDPVWVFGTLQGGGGVFPLENG